MKDLFLYVADADAQAFMTSILNRPKALLIRPVDFDTERHAYKDFGMIQSGAELVRMKKRDYHKALLAWDHHGSGRDHKQKPEDVQREIQKKLDSFTWKDRSATIILVPELEQWLWYCEKAISSHYGLMDSPLHIWLEERASKLGVSITDLKKDKPKELFEHIIRDRLKRTISPRDFEEMGKRAGINELMQCDSFRDFVEILRTWFPAEKTSSPRTHTEDTI